MTASTINQRKSADETFMEIARSFAERSYATRNKVGCVIVDQNGRIVSTGYNGTPKGVDNSCENDMTTYEYVIHAELNAIFNATTHNLNDCTAYVTVSPCIRCAAALLQKGITTVFYDVPYRDLSGVHFLRNHGVTVYCLSDFLIGLDMNK